MFKFEVGDQIIVNHCTDEIDEMMQRVGETLTITGKFEGCWNGTLYNAYNIEEDHGKWAWREDWLELAEYAPKGDILPVSEDELLDMFGV